MDSLSAARHSERLVPSITSSRERTLAHCSELDIQFRLIALDPSVARSIQRSPAQICAQITIVKYVLERINLSPGENS
jgi:hypothetical protein